MEISRLRVANEDFLVASMIDRCPKSMMLRELVKNALEAAANATHGGSRVEIAPIAIDGVRKLCIWNTGPGMTGDELFRMCDIASSIGKPNALDQNFGMGAKVASLPSNHLGIRYRSCRGGRVHQVVMGKRGDVYGRLRQFAASGEAAEIVEVTAEAADARDLSIDWTEVVLFGNREAQDTVADPYNGAPAMSAGWIAEELYGRFHAIPAGIDLILRDGCNIAGGDRSFVPLAARCGDFSRYERVVADGGVALHYRYDAPDAQAPGRLLSDRGALQPAQSSAALVFRGEIYDCLAPWAWLHDAPVYGLPFGARYISIFVELPDDFPALPDGYRQFLRHNHNLQQHVLVREFTGLALRHRPAWLIELLRSFAPDASHTDHLTSEMAGLFRMLGVRRRWWPPGPAGKPPPLHGDGIEYEIAPEIVPLRDENDVNERGIQGKAARFYAETHQLFINTSYAAFTDFRTTLENEYATIGDQEQVRRTAVIVTEQLLIRQICRKLIFGLSKRGAWHGWEVDQATSMYSLSLASDDNTSLFDEARSNMRAALGVPAPPDPRIEQARIGLANAMENVLTLYPEFGRNQPLELLIRLQSPSSFDRAPPTLSPT